MSFPWTTPAQRRQREAEERLATIAVANAHRTMADILREQAKVNVIRPAATRSASAGREEE